MSLVGTPPEIQRTRRFGARLRLVRRRARKLPPTIRGMFWMVLAGIVLTTLNAVLRKMTLVLDPIQAQFLRYLCGLLLMLPLVMRYGWTRFRPSNLRGQFLRGAVHAAALALWFTALPHLSLADVTALGFTMPIFIMIGAAVIFRERMRWDRWAASLMGFAGILIVVGPNLAGTGGWYTLVMLSSAPMLAASFLITKALTRYESAAAIVLWQAVTVTVLSFPFALLHWQWPSNTQWALFGLAGLLGTAGQYFLTRAFATADISSVQSVKFLDLVWATLLGLLMFAELPSKWTLIGGSVICGATIWIARREARSRRQGAADPDLNQPLAQAAGQEVNK